MERLSFFPDTRRAGIFVSKIYVTIKNHIMDLNKLRDEAYPNAKANGWNDEEHGNGHLLMLIITEIVEAVQADRKGGTCRRGQVQGMAGQQHPAFRRDKERRFKEDFEAYIKNTVEDELADVVMRLP